MLSGLFANGLYFLCIESKKIYFGKKRVFFILFLHISWSNCIDFNIFRCILCEFWSKFEPHTLNALFMLLWFARMHLYQWIWKTSSLGPQISRNRKKWPKLAKLTISILMNDFYPTKCQMNYEINTLKIGLS